MKETKEIVRTEFETGTAFFDCEGERLVITDIEIRDGDVHYHVKGKGYDNVYSEKVVKKAFLKIPDDKF